MNDPADMNIPLPTGDIEAEFASLVHFARRDNIHPQAVARLAEHLATSGERLTWPATARTTDVASTGGPGSLSTLLPPFALRGFGSDVVKLSVPGRPAGAIDSLGTLPGYRVHLSPDEVRAVVARCGFAHFLADERFAPLDAALFSYRRKVGAVALPLLAAASILAKKLAVGVRVVGLDVRVSAHGNFGTTLEAAREHARVFCEAASTLGVRAVAFLSPSDVPMQPFIGRGEALVALAASAGLLSLPPSSWLTNHIRRCYQMAYAVATIDNPLSDSLVPHSPERQSELVRRALEAHLAAQGSSIDALRQRVSEIINSPHLKVRASNPGILLVDLQVIRDALVRIQADTTPGVFRDPAGIELLVPPGQEVRAGDELARVRCDSHAALGGLAIELKNAFLMLPRDMTQRPDGDPESIEVVRG